MYGLSLPELVRLFNVEIEILLKPSSRRSLFLLLLLLCVCWGFGHDSVFHRSARYAGDGLADLHRGLLLFFLFFGKSTQETVMLLG